MADPATPAGKIVRPDGADVSQRDRSGDGTIILRRGVEKGHNYKFGSQPEMPWKMAECPTCHGSGFDPSDRGSPCPTCDGQGEVTVAKRRKTVGSDTDAG